ncbi:MAG: hypothetical protein ABJB86_00305 [Bacteroidota bacterium]
MKAFKKYGILFFMFTYAHAYAQQAVALSHYVVFPCIGFLKMADIKKQIKKQILRSK